MVLQYRNASKRCRQNGKPVQGQSHQGLHCLPDLLMSDFKNLIEFGEKISEILH